MHSTQSPHTGHVLSTDRHILKCPHRLNVGKTQGSAHVCTHWAPRAPTSTEFIYSFYGEL